MKSDVFVSYASDDREVAEVVREALERQHIRCWIAPRDIPAGAVYADSIIKAIQKTRALVLIFSAKADQSPHVLREVERAVSNKVPVIPIRIEDVLPSGSMEYFISSQQWLDASVPPVEQYLDKLVDAIRHRMSDEDAVNAEIVPEDRRQTRRQFRNVVARFAWGKLGCVFSVTLLGLMLMMVPMAGLVLWNTPATRESANRTTSRNNLMQIGLALYIYADVNGNSLPAVGSPHRRDGSGLSWRVQLLPYLEQEALYRQFHLNEPWDSPHNRTLIEHMPLVFKSPIFQGDDYKTIYLAVVGLAAESANGARTVFQRDLPTKFSDFRDEFATTIMVVEVDVDQAVIWTQPSDWELSLTHPRHGLGQNWPHVFWALYGDGHVELVGEEIDNETLKGLMLINDGKPEPDVR